MENNIYFTLEEALFCTGLKKNTLRDAINRDKVRDWTEVGKAGRYHIEPESLLEYCEAINAGKVIVHNDRPYPTDIVKDRIEEVKLFK